MNFSPVRLTQRVRRYHRFANSTGPGLTRSRGLVVMVDAKAKQGAERLELVVVGKADADRLARLVTPNCHPLLGNANCSVLVVRD